MRAKTILHVQTLFALFIIGNCEKLINKIFAALHLLFNVKNAEMQTRLHSCLVAIDGICARIKLINLCRVQS